MDDSDWLALRLEVEQLFSGAPVNEEELFAGRLSEVRRMLEAVFDPSKHVILFGERGVGKTSIANVFWRRYNAQLQTFVAARIQADPADDFASLWRKAAEELVHVARSAGKYELVPIDPASKIQSVDDVRRTLQKCRPNAIPILIFDEFDKLRDSHARELFANVVKSLHDYSVNATLIMVGVAEDVASLINDHQSIGRALSQIKLERMSDSELNEVIDKRLNKTALKVAGDARWTIVSLSRGLPFFTQMLTKYAALDAVDAKRIRIDVENVEAAMSRFIEESDQLFVDAYDAATASPQKGHLFREVLLACALARTDGRGYFAPADVVEPLSGIMGARKTIAHFARHLNEFLSSERGQILSRRGYERAYRFRFSDPMMQPYIIIKGIREGMVSDAAREAIIRREQPFLPNVT